MGRRRCGRRAPRATLNHGDARDAALKHGDARDAARAGRAGAAGAAACGRSLCVVRLKRAGARARRLSTLECWVSGVNPRTKDPFYFMHLFRTINVSHSPGGAPPPPQPGDDVPAPMRAGDRDELQQVAMAELATSLSTDGVREVEEPVERDKP